MLPLVTVAMPVYNAGQYLRLAVLSIVQQTFTNWELLIIDDGSTDNAIQAIEGIEDSRIRIISDGLNKGLAVRLNEAIDMARGQYLARMDQDDVSYPERFARQIAALQDDSALDLVATRTLTIDEGNRMTGLFPYSLSHGEICAHPWRGFYFPHPTWMGRVEWFRQYRYTLPGLYFCEDQELLLRSYSNSRFATLDEVLFAYRIRSQLNWQKLAKTRRTVLLVQIRHFFKQRRWDFGLLSVGIFIAKAVNDRLKKWLPCSSTCAIVDSADAARWNAVLKSLAQESGLP